MTARLRNSFRSGNLAEHLGLLLLKGVAAVAEVSRPEDIGIDAIATLLRSDADGNSYAEDSFIVQIKSASCQKLEYTAHEIPWLVKQSQPMFIGRVSLATSQIAMYSTLHIGQAIHALHAQKVTAHFGQSDLPPFLRGQEWMPWCGDGEEGCVVWLGEPVVSWTLHDFADRQWAGRIYENLKRFLAVAHRELELLSIGQSSVLSWSTNDSDSIKSQYGLMKGHPDELGAMAERLGPHLHALMIRARSIQHNCSESITIALLALAKSFRELGIEIDPHDFFGKFCSTSGRSNCQSEESSEPTTDVFVTE